VSSGPKDSSLELLDFLLPFVSRQKEVLPKAKMPPAARFSFQGKKKRWKENPKPLFNIITH